MHGRKLLGQILKERKVLQEGQIQEALSYQHRHAGQAGLIGKILIGKKFARQADIAMALAIQSGMPYEEIDQLQIKPQIIKLIDSSTAKMFGVLPLREEGQTLVVAVADPVNRTILDDLHFMLNREVRGVIAAPDKVAEKIAKYYGRDAKELDDTHAVIQSVGREPLAKDQEALARSTPIVRLLNSILHHAIRDRASDIHFEAFADEYRIRYRVDGVLYEIESPPALLAAAVTARIKVMANLDIAETRLPQDGRIELAMEGRAVDLRVATMPGPYGESCVLRVLDRSNVSLDLDRLGLRDEEVRQLQELTKLSHGIVLVTGPTGSGKTTTLYAMLSYVNDPTIKIITTEDPVEYDLEGIVQIPIHEEIGVTYDKVLRTILRQDPDMILVGEIRDRATAQIAVEASLTGHLVFSTLHTNDAVSAVSRLVDMGVEPYLLTTTLEGIVAQRLVRRICDHCRESYQPDSKLLLELGLQNHDLEGAAFYYGKGCERCLHSGYRGRFAIFEILRLNETMRQTLLTGASTSSMRQLAQAAGMRTLRESGLLAVTQGFTTIEEVIRETIAED